MATTLPVQIEFSLPDGWIPAPPDEVGAPGVAFVALHPESHGSFRTNITISGQPRPDSTPLAIIADETFDRLKQGAVAILADRREVGSPEAPGLTQVVRVSTTIDGEPIELIQSQVYLSFQDVDDAAKRAVVELVLTTTAEVFQRVVPDFQKFVASVRPAENQEAPADA